METSPAIRRKPYLVIRPVSGWAALELGELWRFRDLLLTLAGRDVRLRYRQTALGVIWVVLQPLMLAAGFTLVFGVIAKLPTDGLPTFVISYAGLLGWNVFNTMISKGGISLVGNAHLVSKVYFPRLALPLSVVFSTLLDFVVALAVMAGLMIWYHVTPGLRLLSMPLWLAMFLALGGGFALMTAALTVSYRDVQYIVPVLLMVLQYVSPVGYVVGRNVHGRLLRWYMLNPLAGLIEAFRWSILGRETVHWGYVLQASIVSVAILLIGMICFKRMERKFADVI